jgi:integrase
LSQPVLRSEKPTGWFYVHWSENRRSFRRSLKTKDAATARERFAKWLLTDHSAPGAVVSTIGECWARYTAQHHPVSAVEMGRMWEWLLKPVFGTMTVAAFDQAAVNRYVGLRVEGRVGRKAQPQSTRKELSAVVAAINFCQRAKLLGPVVPNKVTLPLAGQPRDRWLRREEIDALLDAADDTDLRLFLHIALNTAGRVQAILDLTWDRVDFETGVIHLDVPGRFKTKKRRASVPVSTSLMPVLREAYALTYFAHLLPAPKLFPGVTANAVWTKLNAAVLKAGLGVLTKTDAKRPRATGVGPHVLRHTAATHMVRNGVPLAHVAAILGNTVAVVEKTYAHHCPQHLRAAVDSISGGK